MFPFGQSHHRKRVVAASVLGVLIAASDVRAQPEDAADGVAFEDRFFIDGQVAPTFTRPEVVEFFSDMARTASKGDAAAPTPDASTDETQQTGSIGSVAFAEPKGPAKVLKDLLKAPVKELLVSRAEAKSESPPPQGEASAPSPPGNAASEPTSVPARSADPLSERPALAEAAPEQAPTAAPQAGGPGAPPQGSSEAPPDKPRDVAAPPAAAPAPTAAAPAPTADQGPRAPVASSPEPAATGPGSRPEPPAARQDPPPSEQSAAARPSERASPPAGPAPVGQAERAASERHANRATAQGRPPSPTGSAEISRTRTMHSGPRRRASGAPPASEALAKLSLPDDLAPTDWLQSGNQKRAYVSEMGWLRGDEDVLKMVRQPLPAVPSPLARAVSVCGEAISGVAKARGAIRTETTAAAPERRRKPVRTVPVEVRLTYSGWPSSEVRQARVACLLHGSGQVVGLAPLERQTVPLSEFSTVHDVGAPQKAPDSARAGQAAASGER